MWKTARATLCLVQHSGARDGGEKVQLWALQGPCAERLCQQWVLQTWSLFFQLKKNKTFHLIVRSSISRCWRCQVCFSCVFSSHSLWGAVPIPDLSGRALRWPAETKWRWKEEVCISRSFIPTVLWKPQFSEWVSLRSTRLCIYRSFFPLCRLAEKKATIGYTYEDSTVTEPEPQSDKDEDNSENSESEEDEGIPDIGEQMDWCI